MDDAERNRLINHVPVPARVASLLARKSLQPVWEKVVWLGLSGLGYHNYVSKLNGEDRYIDDWVARNPGPVVFFDVGANEGAFAERILQHNPVAKVHIFEPHPQTFGRLHKRFADRAELNNVALGDAPGELDLYDIAGFGGSDQASLFPQAISERHTAAMVSTKTRVITIDDYCAEHNVDRIDYLKMDVEGAEGMVFAGAAKMIAERRVGVVHFEMNVHNVWSGFTEYRASQLLPHHRISRLLPKGEVEITSSRTKYRPGYDIFRYHTLIAEPE